MDYQMDRWMKVAGGGWWIDDDWMVDGKINGMNG